MATAKSAAKATSAKSKSKSAKSTKSTKSTKTTKATSDGLGVSIVKRAKSVGWLAILESIAVGVLGGVIAWNPSGMMQIIFYTVGIFLIVKGTYRIVNYFAIHGKYDFYNNDLLYGIIALVFGVLAVVLWEKLSGAISLVVGAWIIYGALVRMNTAIKLHAAGVKEWFYVLLLSLMLMALGVYMLINLGAVLTLVGWTMIAAAVVGIADDIIFLKHINAITSQN